MTTRLLQLKYTGFNWENTMRMMARASSDRSFVAAANSRASGLNPPAPGVLVAFTGRSDMGSIRHRRRAGLQHLILAHGLRVEQTADAAARQH